MKNQLLVLVGVFFIFICLGTCSKRENGTANNNHLSNETNQHESAANLNSITNFFFHEIHGR